MCSTEEYTKMRNDKGSGVKILDYMVLCLHVFISRRFIDMFSIAENRTSWTRNFSFRGIGLCAHLF